MVRAKVIDSHGTSNGLRVTDEGAANVVVHPHPPEGETVHVLPYRAYFADANGSNDMAVNGATNNVSFYIEGNPEFDIYIKSISVVIGDGGSPALNLFGALSALTNGVQWLYCSIINGEYELHDGIKTNLEFIRLGVDTGAVGTGSDAYLADVSGGGSEKSYLPTIDLHETYGMPYGIPLRRGTTDRLEFRVRDNLTGLTTFNAIAYGQRLNDLRG